MKKTAWICLALVALTILASCGAASKLVGTWEDPTGLTSYTFNKNGTGSYSIAGVDVDFTYEVDGETLTLTAKVFGVSAGTDHTLDIKNKTTIVIDGVTLTKK